MTVTAVIGTVLMVTGTVVSVLAAWGIVDFPSPGIGLVTMYTL